MRSYSSNDEPIPGYRLIERLGQGSFGVVWKAEGPGGVLVALKIISNLNGIHAIREWQSLQNVMNLKQANLVEIYGVWLKNEEGQVLRAEEVRALIPPDTDVAVPVTETASPPLERKRSVWSGDKKSSKPSRPTHYLESATLQSDDDPQTADAQAGSTDALSNRTAERESTTDDPKEGVRPAGLILPGSSPDSAGSKGSGATGSKGKWSKAGGVPPLELVSAMTLGEGTLMSRLKQYQGQGQKGIPRPELMQYMREAAKGLQYLNDRAMHHCDVKPENLLLVGGSVKVCDYGSALRTIYSAESRTHQGYTEQYAAPEQLSGRRVKLHASTDLYALALTYYALRTGKYPWGDVASEPIAVLKYSEKFDFSALAKLARYPYEWQVIRRALKRDPGERFSTTTEFFETLERAVRREEEAMRARRRRRIRNALLIATAAALLGLGVAGWFQREELARRIWTVTPQQRFSLLVASGTPADMSQAIQLIQKSPSELGPDVVVERIARGLQGMQIGATTPEGQEALQSALADILTLKSEYRAGLAGPVQVAATELFENRFAKNIQQHDYQTVIDATEAFPGLSDWGLQSTVQSTLMEKWQQDAQGVLATAVHDSALAAESVAPLAALAAAAEDDPQRQSQIDKEVESLLQQWADQANQLLSDSKEISAAGAKYAWVAAVADRYSSLRKGAGTEFRALAAEAAVGGAAARFRAGRYPTAQLTEELFRIAERDLESRPHALARLMLLKRALNPDESELVGTTFLKEELPKLSALGSEWERQTLAKIKGRAVAVAEDRAQQGTLANLEEVLAALADDRLLLESVKGALATATGPSADIAKAAAEARKLLDGVRLKDPSDELARSALQAWLTLIETDRSTAAQVLEGVKAFQEWAAQAPQDARLDDWFQGPRGFVFSIARRSERWPQKTLSTAIADLEGELSSSETPLNVPLVDLALRAQRMLKLAVDPELKSTDLSTIREDSARLLAARSEESAGGLVRSFIQPAVLVDALWLEAELVPLAMLESSTPPPAELKTALDRVTAHLAMQESAPPSEALGPLGYFQYVADLHRALGKSTGDDLTKILQSPEESDEWLKPALRHTAAAAMLLKLSGKLPPLPRDADYARFRGASATGQQAFLARARQWAIAGTKQQVFADARRALYSFYAADEPDWQEILDCSSAAVSAPELGEILVDQAELSHLLLVHAQALLAVKGEADPKAVIHAFAEVLRRECDPYGHKCRFSDATLYERAVHGVNELIGEKSPSELEVEPVDVAIVLGSLGALLERDITRRIAVDHYDFYAKPDAFFDGTLRAFRKATQWDDDPARKLRWLAGEALALDRRAELRPLSEIDALIESLTKVAGQMEELQPRFFGAAALRGLIAFYQAPQVNDLGDLALGKSQREQALEAFHQSLQALNSEADSPWRRTWQATVNRIASHVCLQQSWALPWGPAMQKKLQDAIQLAKDAKDVAPNDLEKALASATLGNTYEDLAFYLKCVAFYQQAETEFLAAQKLATVSDPYLELLFERNLYRVRHRRLGHDPSLSDADREKWKQELPAAMEGLVKRMENRGLTRYLTFTQFWLAEMLSLPAKPPVADLKRAEELYDALAADASGSARAKRLHSAADCAWRLAIADDDKVAGERAVERTINYLAELKSLEPAISQASLRYSIAQLRATVNADRHNTYDGIFEEYLAERDRHAQATGLTPGESARFQIRLQLMVAKTKCESEPNFALRKAAIAQCDRLLRENRSVLEEREYVTLLLDTAVKAVACGVEQQQLFPKTKLPAWDLFLRMKTALEAAKRAEQQIGSVECCATPTEPPVGDPVSGFPAVLETRAASLLLGEKLVEPLFEYDQQSKVDRIAALEWIKEQLEDLKEVLPRDGEAARTIDNKYLRDLDGFLRKLRGS